MKFVDNEMSIDTSSVCKFCNLTFAQNFWNSNEAQNFFLDWINENLSP